MSKKSLFNFYLDDDIKLKATNKLNKLCGNKEKGQLASFLRVTLKRFVETPDEEVEHSLLADVEREYEVCLKSNKRSRL